MIKALHLGLKFLCNIKNTNKYIVSLAKHLYPSKHIKYNKFNIQLNPENLLDPNRLRKLIKLMDLKNILKLKLKINLLIEILFDK